MVWFCWTDFKQESSWEDVLCVDFLGLGHWPLVCTCLPVSQTTSSRSSIWITFNKCRHFPSEVVWDQWDLLLRMCDGISHLRAHSLQHGRNPFTLGTLWQHSDWQNLWHICNQLFIQICQDINYSEIIVRCALLLHFWQMSSMVKIRIEWIPGCLWR